MKPRYLHYDNVDDRKELLHLLQMLPSNRARKDFLAWCCQQAALVPGKPTKPRVSQKTRGESLEVFFDLWALAMQYHLSFDAMTDRLVSLVRGKETGGTLLSRN